MKRPLIVLAEPMYHPDGEALLRGFCELRVLTSPTAAQVRAAAADADALVVRYPHKADAALLDAAPRLLIVASSGRGTDSIDIDAASGRGVAVVNNPGHGRRPVSEGAIALMLALAKRLTVLDGRMRRGEGWRVREFAEFMELGGKTLGIVGLGEIGTETARKAVAAFGMQVLAYDPYAAAGKAASVGARAVGSLDELLRASDVVSLHPELTHETRGMIGEEQLRLMKPGAFLVNTSRGKVVRHDALVRALREGWIAGAGLDVYEEEPLGPGNSLYAFENVVLMPHVAGLTGEAVQGMSRSAAGQVLQVLRGEKPPHLVNLQVWPRTAERARQAAFFPARSAA